MIALQLDLVDWIGAAPLPERVYLRRVDPGRNMRRFYSLAIERTLFGEYALVREWGRLGRGGQVKATVFPTLSEAHGSLLHLQDAKEKKGYRGPCRHV